MSESAIPGYITSLIRHFEDLRDDTRQTDFAKRVRLNQRFGSPRVQHLPGTSISSVSYAAIVPLPGELPLRQTRR